MASDDHARNSEHEHTFDELQRLTENPFHELGDALLPWMFPEVQCLKTHGKTPKGKTRPGVPDSYVGSEPATCHVAVEYTTQEKGLASKLNSDYDEIRRKCLDARTVVLCTNRCVASEELSSLLQKAATDGVTLHLVDGCALARCLCEKRPDLRRRFLSIPIDAHTRESLRRTLEQALDHWVCGRIKPEALARFIARPHADRQIHEVTHNHRNGLLMVVAPAGMGKSTWSVNHAHRYASIEPVFWSAVGDIALNGTDPISIKIVHAAYGAPDPNRITELAELLRRERQSIRVVLDAVDECRDYDAFSRALREFRSGRLGEVTNVILTCREGAVPLLEETLGVSFRGLFELRDGYNKELPVGQIRLEPLDEEKERSLLQKEGATASEATIVLRALPRQFRGNPFFLVHALPLARAEQLPLPEREDAPAWIGAFVDHLVRDIETRLKTGGQGWPSRRIRKFLERISLLAIESSSATVSDEQIEELPDGDVSGENTVLERAIQVGLLVRRGNGVGFSHARFLGHFASTALRHEPIDNWIRRARGNSGREVLGQLIIADSEPERLLRLLLAHDPEAACDVAGNLRERVKDIELRRAILDRPKGLLRSRYRSDRERALLLLKKLHWPEAVQFAMDWWNALPSNEKSRSMRYAADLFLAMEVHSAFRIIMNHFWLSLPRPWYDLTFVSQLESTSQKFRQSLAKQAWEVLAADPTSSGRPRIIQLLAILREDGLVQELKRKFERELLEGYEHRALLHLNTDASIELYFDSVCKCHEWYDAREDDNGFKYGAAREQRTRMGVDVLYFPHDVLLRRVGVELGSDIRSRIRVACECAAFLGDESFICSYYSARRRLGWARSRPNSHGFMATIAKRSSFDHLANLYKQHIDIDINDDIVDCMELVPCAESETFLIQRLAEPRHTFVAAQSLGRMGSMRAGPALVDVLKRKAGAETEFPCEMVIEALGRIGYTPAEEVLIERMQLGNIFPAADALGRIATSSAFKALADAFARATDVDDWEILLRALLCRRERKGIQIVKELLMRFPEAELALAPAVGYWDIVDMGKRFNRLQLPLGDLELGLRVVESARRLTALGKYSMGDFHLDGVACCDCPEATEFLEQMAQGDLQGSTRVVNISWQARHLLALRGHSTYERIMVEEFLSQAFEQRLPAQFGMERLRQWTRLLVRTVLLEHVDRSDHVRECLDLLRWFATDKDLELFKRFHDHEDDEIADIAHVYLSHREVFVQRA